MLTSIIIPVWNGRPFLSACLQAVLAQSQADFEIIAVDNASQDGSADFIAAEFPQARLIRSLSNRGFSGGCNLGMQAAQGEVLMLLNQDAVVRPDWLRASLAALVEHPQAGIVGGKGLYPDGRQLQHAGGRLEWPLGLAQHDGYQEQDDGRWDTPREVEYVTGAAMGIRRAVVEKIGWLDEGFWPGYYEDTDYCLRARQAGFQIWYCPQATYLHQESASTHALNRSWYTQRGRLRLVLKHLPPERLLTDFVPAERAAQLAAIHQAQSRALRLTYLEIILEAPAILRARGLHDPAFLLRLQEALRDLYRWAWQTDWQVLLEKAAIPPEHELTQPASGNLAASESRTSNWLKLQEYSFDSVIPVVGRLIKHVRWWWFNMAVRWELRYVILQQESINQRLYQLIAGMSQRLRDLADENVILASRLAALDQNTREPKD